MNLSCVLATDCSSEPLGMEDKSIRDVKITASSSYNAGHGPSNARLNFKAGGGKTGAWSAGANDANQWLKVEFDGPVQITDIQIQGREDCCDQFVRSYTVSYSSDNRNFISYKRGGQAAVRLAGLADQFRISHAASPETLHHTIWRTWLFIPYWDERWLYYQFSLPHLYISF